MRIIGSQIMSMNTEVSVGGNKGGQLDPNPMLYGIGVGITPQRSRSQT